MALLDRCIFNPAAGGTADFVVVSAVTGYMTPAQAGGIDGATYHYAAQSADLSQWEVGTGVYTAGTTTLSRATVLFNSLGTTAKINFSAAPQVFITALAEDLYIGPSASFFARAATLSNADMAAYDTFISTLVYAGIWSQLDCIWDLSGPDQATSMLNMVQNNFNLTAVGGPTFTANKGWAGGTNMYLETGFDPSAQPSNYGYSYGNTPSPAGPGNFLQYSGSFGAWCESDPGGGGLLGLGQNTYIQPKAPGVAYRVNATSDDSHAVFSPVTGFYSASRIDTSHLRLLKDGVSVATSNASATAGTSAGTFRLVVDGTFNDWNSGYCGFTFIGGALSDYQHYVLYNAVVALRLARGVT